MIRFLAVLFLLVPTWCLANPLDTNCPSIVSPFGAPISHSNSARVNYECHKGYAVLVSFDTKDPIYVLEHMTKSSLTCLVHRSNNFHADKTIPVEFRATPADYKGSGYDQGHMSSAQDNCADSTEMDESFLMSNMVPQNPNNNRGIWKYLEEYVRALAETNDIYVISGPVFIGTTHNTIGNGVLVPEELFKVIFNNTTNTFEAWVLPNTAIPVRDLPKYKVTVRYVEDISGLKLFPLKK